MTLQKWPGCGFETYITACDEMENKETRGNAHAKKKIGVFVTICLVGQTKYKTQPKIFGLIFSITVFWIFVHSSTHHVLSFPNLFLFITNFLTFLVLDLFESVSFFLLAQEF